MEIESVGACVVVEASTVEESEAVKTFGTVEGGILENDAGEAWLSN